MKTKYIIVSLIAALGLLFTGCVEEADHYLDEVKVSSSYVTFSAGGGSVPVELNATGSWSVTNLPEWVTVSPATGGAGLPILIKLALGSISLTPAVSRIKRKWGVGS